MLRQFAQTRSGDKLFFHSHLGEVEKTRRKLNDWSVVDSVIVHDCLISFKREKNALFKSVYLKSGCHHRSL